MHRKITAVLFSAVILISAVAHGWNMFNFPYYENDEGVYFSQAWSLLKLGKIAPYTYWYDHAPAGWIFLAFWAAVSGGFYTFGFSLNSGRVFMLILHVFSTLLLLLITKKLTRSNFAAVVAGLFFALTPLGLYFHRRILLDNIMVFWVMLSYYFVIKDKLKLNDVLLSALFFGVAVLTKENAIFFIPGFLVTVYIAAHHYHRKLALLKWSLVSGLVISLYFLFALLKGELFPFGSFLGGTTEHVSLIETLKYQSSRDGGSVFKVEGSTFWKHFFLWIEQDPFLVIGGIIGTLLTLIFAFSKNKRHYFGVIFLTIFFWLFLMRGGIVIEFYIVPLLPISAALIGISAHEILQLLLKSVKGLLLGTRLVIIFTIFLGYVLFSQDSRAFGQDSPSHRIFESKQADAQRQAVDWLRANVDPNSIVIIDNHAYIDLQDTENPSSVVFPDAEWYWKVDQDREVREDLLEDNPEKIDIIAVTPQLTGDLKSGMSPLTYEALQNSKIWKTFEIDNWGVQLWRPYYPRHILKRSWISYKKNFINDGRVFDPQLKYTTSEGQSYALLRAVWSDDKETFDSVLNWTNRNLKKKNELFSWKYGFDKSGNLSVLDLSSASDADQDIALALLFAYKKWAYEAYLTQAQKIITSIWEEEIVFIGNKPYLLPGDWAKDKDKLIINPSYVSPFAYRVFSDVDSNHDWGAVVDTSYEVLQKCSKSTLDVSSPVFLPPEWCEIIENGEAVTSTQKDISASHYGYNAMRVPWKVALDYSWYEDPQALEYLQNLSFFVEEFKTRKKIYVAYTHDGKPWEEYESAIAYANSLPVFQVLEPNIADEIYETKVKEKFYEDDMQNYWEDPGNYYTQNWVWFGTALYADLLPNLWVQK